MAITPDQCRAARALVGLSQADLAAKAAVAKKTVEMFEAGRTAPTLDTLAKLERALIRAGVAFIHANGGGPGVRLRRRP